jgi:hypothetical protein
MPDNTFALAARAGPPIARIATSAVRLVERLLHAMLIGVCCSVPKVGSDSSGGAKLSCQLAPAAGQDTAAPAPAPGTYRVRLCAESCSATEPDAAAAVAIVVLLDDVAAAGEPARSALAALRRLDYWSLRDTLPASNACFKVTRSERQVGTDQLFFGITSVLLRHLQR